MEVWAVKMTGCCEERKTAYRIKRRGSGAEGGRRGGPAETAPLRSLIAAVVRSHLLCQTPAFARPLSPPTQRFLFPLAAPQASQSPLPTPNNRLLSALYRLSSLPHFIRLLPAKILLCPSQGSRT